MSLTVIKPGLLTTVQDSGRSGYQKYGVSVGGAMDPFAFRAANLLAGNDPGEAALEMTVAGPELRFEADRLVAICGADMQPDIDGEPVPLWRPVAVAKGSVLRFRSAASGVRAYLAVSGGFALPRVMGSRSADLRAGLDGLAGRALATGDVLPLNAPTPLGKRLFDRLAGTVGRGRRPFAAAAWYLSPDMFPDYRPDPLVRVMEGRQAALFEPESIRRFYTEAFALQPQSDRMGFRLQSEPLKWTAAAELLSEPVAFGTIQVPPDGRPIILMADRQSTGGYPKIAQVITADLPLLAQVRIGGLIRFRRIGLQEAQEAKRKVERNLALLRESITLKVRQGEL